MESLGKHRKLSNRLPEISLWLSWEKKKNKTKLSVQNEGRGKVTAAWTPGDFVVSVWSKAVIKLPL